MYQLRKIIITLSAFNNSDDIVVLSTSISRDCLICIHSKFAVLCRWRGVMWSREACGTRSHSSRHHHGARRQEGEELERAQAGAGDRRPQGRRRRALQEVQHKRRARSHGCCSCSGLGTIWQERAYPTPNHTRMGEFLIALVSIQALLCAHVLKNRAITQPLYPLAGEILPMSLLRVCLSALARCRPLLPCLQYPGIDARE